jgi:hypothetical protein
MTATRQASSSMRASMAERGEDRFRAVRAAAQGQLVIVRPERQWLLLPAWQKDAASPDRVAAVERMMPSQTKRNVAVIGEVIWAAGDIPTRAPHGFPRNVRFGPGPPSSARRKYPPEINDLQGFYGRVLAGNRQSPACN